jgi:predicted acylesterase/phospholipase RssA
MNTIQAGEQSARATKMGVLVSGGAPNLHLAAGALCAFYEHGLRFDLIGTAGAGALPALLSMVPKNGDPAAALKSTVYINIHDVIYSVIPDNYKIFLKRGPLTEAFWRFGRSLPHFDLLPDDRRQSALRRLFNDSVDLMVAALTPTTLWYGSSSVCTRAGVIDDLVDWPALAGHSTRLFLNAFDLGALRLTTFDNDSLRPESFYAALAMPWLYEPTVVEGRMYTEGAAHDPSGLEAIWDRLYQDGRPRVNMLIALDTVVTDLWLDPGNIQEALELAVMDPIVCLGEYVLALYSRLDDLHERKGVPTPKLYYVPFPIQAQDARRILDWSYSNALSLWDIGYAAAKKFCLVLDAANRSGNPDHFEQCYRYYKVRRYRPLIRDFLSLFDSLFEVLSPR